jgi:cold shock CspA family protein
MATIPPRFGDVADFDEERGLGTVRDAEGRQFGFHCTQIADGTRTIAVGAPVVFVMAPGSLGRWEATGIVKLAAP